MIVDRTCFTPRGSNVHCGTPHGSTKELSIFYLGVQDERVLKEERVSHMSFADNCYLFAATKSEMLKMIGDAAGNLQDRGLN